MREGFGPGRGRDLSLGLQEIQVLRGQTGGKILESFKAQNQDSSRQGENPVLQRLRSQASGMIGSQGCGKEEIGIEMPGIRDVAPAGQVLKTVQRGKDSLFADPRVGMLGVEILESGQGGKRR